MRSRSLPPVAALFLGAVFSACRLVDPTSALTPQELRMLALDSLARSHPCAALRAKLIYDPLFWTERQACAVAGRALAILGAAKPFRDLMAPSDTAEVVTMSIFRQRGCKVTLVGNTLGAGRVDPLSYIVLMEVPARPHFIGVGMNATGFSGEAVPNAHPRGVWGGSIHLELVSDQMHPNEEGSPCGDD
jgi:hypothetical protein